MTKALGRGKKARSFSGCKCCKQAKRKCPEEHPQCSICEKLGLKCEYDLNFLFRCEMVDFTGHISKAARITRPDNPKNQKKDDTTTSETSSESQPPPSPQKFIHYQFIDESASIMSPTWFSDVPTPSPSSSHSPVPSFNLLLKAAQEEELKHKAPINIPLTPPQSPPKTLLVDKSLPSSLRFILN